MTNCRLDITDIFVVQIESVKYDKVTSEALFEAATLYFLYVTIQIILVNLIKSLCP